MNTLVRVFVCLATVCLFVFLSIQKENEITALRMQIPQLNKEVKVLAEENTRLRFEKERFESPENLLRFAATPTFMQYEFPVATNVPSYPRGFSLARNTAGKDNAPVRRTQATLAYTQ